MAHPRIHPGPFGVPALLLVLAAPAHASWAGAQLKTLEVDTAAPATLTLTALAEPPGRIGVRRVDPATGIAAITPLDPAAGPLELTLEPRETLILLFREAQPGTCLEAVLTLAADPAGTLGWFSLRLDPEAEANPWTLTSRSLHRDCRLALRDGHTLRIQHRPPAAGAPGSQAGAGASLETKARQAGAGCPSLLGLAAKADRLQASLRALGERGEYLQAFERVERQYDKEVASQERLVGLRDRQIERVQELKALVRQEGGTPQDFARARQLRDEAQELDRQILGEYRSFQAFLERDLEFADDRIAFLDGKLQEVALRAKAAADPGELANHLNCQYTLWHQRMLWLDHWFSVGDLQATTGQALARAEGATRIFAGCAEEVARYLHAHEITPALKLALDEAEAKREAERCEAKAAELARR